MQFDKDKVNDLVVELVKRLRKLNKHEQAAEYLENFGYMEQAVQSYIQSGNYDKARECCKQIKNKEQQQK